MATNPQPPVFEEPQLVQEPESEFHISQWIEVIRRRRRLLYATTGIVLTGAIVAFLITPKQYRAATVVQIERRLQTSSTTQTSQIFSWEDWADAQSFYPTQFRLLQSRGLAERVVRNLRLWEDPYFNPSRAGLTSQGGGSATADESLVAYLAFAVQGGLEVNPIRNTRLVELGFVARAPEVAARMANAYAEAFIDWGVENRYKSTGRASSFLASQIEALKQEIQDKDAQLQAFSRRTDIVALDAGSNVALQRLQALNGDLTSAMSQRIQAESRFRELTESAPETVAGTLAGGLIDQMRGELARLERDYANKLTTFKPEWPAMKELKAQIDKTRTNLDSVIQETVGKAREQARAEYQTAQRREQSLQAELARQKAEAMKVNAEAVEYNNLLVEVSTRRQLLNELVRRQSETEVASRLQGIRDSNVTVVDRALPPGAPYRPSLQRNLSIGLVLGLGLGLGLVFLLEYLDRSIKAPEDVERVLSLPTLAVIPDLNEGRDGYGTYRYGRRYGYGYGHGFGYGYGQRERSRQAQARAAKKGEPPLEKIELIPYVKPRLPVSEAYRALRTALLMSSADQLHTVLITSAVPGEGKTSTATNLAVVLAQLGNDVLLIDADLRKPRVHEIFSLSNRIGIVNALARKVEFDKVCIPTHVPHLFVTPSGTIPPNPAELLASDRMREMLETIRQRFEYVVIDSPPALPVTDSSILGAIADGVLLCAGAGGLLREDARACRDRLLMSGSRLLGVVLNRFRLTSARYGKKYYSAYQFGSYGETESEVEGAGAARRQTG
ncbi:MAG: polysaccharide biosynthesis tyrosine autokinase [Thermoanaerobaculaceae bacterium]|nr:polysaccharide biosynthesis tyrosine autokinase [Thermoanaerobaculaceae bacterium]MDI9622068.1 polysaccharide biosynthesis tyrosine autokinase [Acidobacteriota bacterium]NLH10341.1 polysaccharide biosynthesis tyrosine autokinase [Holophagae bacterium]